MGKTGETEGCVAIHGDGVHEAAIDGVEVERAFDGLAGEGEYDIVANVLECGFGVCRGRGDGGAATEGGVFGTRVAQPRLELGIALQTDEGVGGHEAGGLHVGGPMVAGYDTAVPILKATVQHGVHAVGGQFDHGHGQSPAESGVGRRVGGGEDMRLLFTRDEGGFGQLNVWTTAEVGVLKPVGFVFKCGADIAEVGCDVGCGGGVELHVQAVGELAEEVVHFACGIGNGLFATLGVALAFGQPVGSHVALIAE